MNNWKIPEEKAEAVSEKVGEVSRSFLKVRQEEVQLDVIEAESLPSSIQHRWVALIETVILDGHRSRHDLAKESWSLKRKTDSALTLFRRKGQIKGWHCTVMQLGIYMMT